MYNMPIEELYVQNLIDLTYALSKYDQHMSSFLTNSSFTQSISILGGLNSSNDLASLNPALRSMLSLAWTSSQNSVPNISQLSHKDHSSNNNGCVEHKVSVKSSAHVSYIVGKQGTKIRHIRDETGTYIQTPVNGDSPIFIVRGTEKNVDSAKKLILLEAEKYDMEMYLEAQSYSNGLRRRMNLYLPSRYIGLVVGRKGSVIQYIMSESKAKIVTPKVNTLNGFRIEGSMSQIRHAIDLIKQHIATCSNVTVREERCNEYEINLDISSN